MSDGPFQDPFRRDSMGNVRMKNPRKMALTFCSRQDCSNRDDIQHPKFKKCARCKASFYCSKECQKRDWPVHKEACNSKTGVDVAIVDSINNFGTNSGFECLRQLLAIYKLGLHLLNDEALEKIKSKPLELVMIVQYEPAEFKDFLRLFDVSATARESPVTAIPQIVALSGRMGEKVAPSSIDMWKFSYNDHAVDPVEHKLPIVVLCIEPMSLAQSDMAVCPRLTTSFPIGDFWMRWAKGLETPSLHTGTLQVPVPVGDPESDVKKVVQFFNEFIRFDVNNLFRLRIKMPWLEQMMVSLASAFTLEGGSLSTIPPEVVETLAKIFACEPGQKLGLDPSALAFIELLLKKIARERIYRSMINHTGPASGGLRRDILARHIVPDEGQHVPEAPEIRFGLTV